MIKTAFLEILRTFNKDELKRFEAFLNSPYFNTRNNVVNLFSVVKKYTPEFSHKNLDKEEIWKNIFPEKEYNYGILKNIIYDITKLAEKFLEVEYMNSNQKQQMNNLLTKLGEKQLDGIFINKYNAFEKILFNSSKYYTDYFQDYMELKDHRYLLSVYNPKYILKSGAIEISELFIFDFIAKFGTNFNNVYIEESELNQSSETEFIRLFSEAVFSDKKLEEYIDKMNNGPEKNYRILKIFFKMMKCYLNPQSISFYFEFKNTLFENDKYITESALRRLYASLGSTLDNCNVAYDINKNRELYNIIFQLVEKNIFLSEDGKAIPSLYLLAVKTSGYLKETLFIEKLRKEFLHKLDTTLQENFKIFSLAYLHYSKNEFDKALEFSNKISIDKFQLKYFLKNLQIIISFEKNDYEMFLFLNDTHKHFLAKNKSVSQSYKESNMKFLNYTNSLFKLKESLDLPEIEFTEKSINNDVVVNKQWLLEKLKEMDKKKSDN